MDLWPPAAYLKEGRRQGGSETTLYEALSQAHTVQKTGLPAILSLAHLAWHVGVPYAYLREVIGRRIDPYRSFPIRKRPRGYRVICVPAPELLRLQRWIHRYILLCLKPHACSQAYGKGCSPVRCAEMHVNSRWLIKADIRQFFESIDEVRVYRLFRECGYRPLVSFELARLTTRLPDVEHRPETARWIVRKPSQYSIGVYRARHLGHLPQGAPTSPMIANLVMREFDERAYRIAVEYGLTYTRYSDDLTFSSQDDAFDRTAARELIRRIYGLMQRYELQPRASKTSVVPPGARRVVLGLLVNEGHPRLSRQFRRRLECHVHFVTKLGYVVHARERGFKSAISCFRYLQGLVAYACQVEPAYGKKLGDQLRAAPPPF